MLVNLEYVVTGRRLIKAIFVCFIIRLIYIEPKTTV